MNKRIVWLLLGVLLLGLLMLAFVGRASREARVITERSIPAVRILGDLRDTLSRLQIGFLEAAEFGAFPGEEAGRAARARLDEAETLLVRYRETIVSAQGRELGDRVGEAFVAYRGRVEALLQAGTEGEEAQDRLRECASAYRELHARLAELREYRLDRVEDRISNLGRSTRRGWLTNLVVLGLLLLGIVVTWYGSRLTAHDRDHL